jgi:hypothetical protein
MSADTLARDFAAVLTDASRMEYDNEDPMRYSKRRTRSAALDTLRNAVAQARQLIELAELVERDHNEFKTELAKQEKS